VLVEWVDPKAKKRKTNIGPGNTIGGNEGGDCDWLVTVR
jgi:hypothetical protein